MPCIFVFSKGDIDEETPQACVGIWGVLILVGGFLALGIYPVSLADQCLSGPPGSYPYPSGFALGIFHLLVFLPAVCVGLFACCGACLEGMSSLTPTRTTRRDEWDNYSFEAEYANRSTNSAIALDSVSSSTLVVTPMGTLSNNNNNESAKDEPLAMAKTVEELKKPAFTKQNSLPVFDPETGMFVADDDYKPPPTADSSYGAPPPSGNDYTSAPPVEYPMASVVEEKKDRGRRSSMEML
eukprot:TRINITY_DN746_c1_g3_i2.p1 TRINITY_DN746_c1_g3~~TRINITY_DN746_c1_g3_i2.p1  ORF type:complete len:240 (-),score=54.29 TRINITY_DN746_c1_g3_i2:1332-2051(-)